MSPATALKFHAPGFRCSVDLRSRSAIAPLRLDQPGGIDDLLAGAKPVPGGRSDNLLVSHTTWQSPIRIRPYRHGGCLGGILGDRFFSPARAEREFSLWSLLETKGAPIPAIIFTASRRCSLLWHSVLAVEEKEQACSLDQWLQKHAESDLTCLQKIAHAIGEGVRTFHDTGAVHGDLHTGNLLLEPTPEGFKVLLIDLDRTRLTKNAQNVSAPARMRELMRLLRSLEKTHSPATYTPRLLASSLAAYCDGNRDMRRHMLESVPSEKLRTGLHRFGWSIRRRSQKLLRSTFLKSTLILCTAAALPLACHNEAPHRQNDQLIFSLLVTGDTGRQRPFPSLLEGQRAVSHGMQKEDEAAPVDGLIFLGDNFYPNGLDPHSLANRIRENLVEPYCHFLALDGPRSAEVSDGCPIPETRRHPVSLYAVLGNHDIETPESARLQRYSVPEFVPGWTMSKSLARTIELGHGVSLILFESEIAIDDKEAMEAALHSALQTSKGPWRIVAAHRPVATDDYGKVPLGGYPVWIRDAIAHSGRPVQLFLAGHHHSLQAFALEQPSKLFQVGAGSGSRTKPPLAVAETGSIFGRMQLGFARLDLTEQTEGAGGDQADRQRLIVSFFSVPQWPTLSALQPSKPLARFEIDLKGDWRTQPLQSPPSKR